MKLMQSIEKEGKILLEKMDELSKAIPSERDDLKDVLENISRTVIRILDLGDEDRRAKQEEIEVLKIRASTLEKKVEKLQTSADSIDAGEAMKIMGTHLARFILPPSEKIDHVAPLDDMIKYTQKQKNARDKWEFLQQQCGMSWDKDHKKVTKDWILHRNKCAHQNKFNLTQLRQVMEKGMPRRVEYCADIMNLFEKVNSLMKLVGVIASDVVVREVIKRKYSKAHTELLNMIMKQFYRDVQHLQDSHITEARKHLIPYISKRDIPLWDEIMSEIRNTNGPRLGKLAKDKEMQVVWKIFREPTITTFDELNTYLMKGKISRKHAEVEEQWNKLSDGKEWTTNHSMAMRRLKRLLPENQEQ